MKRHFPQDFGLEFFNNRPFFDGFFFDEMPPLALFGREERRAKKRPQNSRPVYPPIDPFGNTEYIPLPGPSSPAHALPLTQGNPHMHQKTRFGRFGKK